MILTVATCQFPTSGDISANLDFVLCLLQEAKTQGADVASFPECALSGYAGSDFETNASIDWQGLASAVAQVAAVAASLQLWVILGSAHRLTPPHKPHNSLYIISDEGRIVDRYDKRFLSGDAMENPGDLAHYSPGDHFSVFDIKGVRCGALICVDCRYPELYRAYKRLGVELMFHSYHAGHIDDRKWVAIETEIGEKIVPSTQPRHSRNHSTRGDACRCRQQLHVDQLSEHRRLSQLLAQLLRAARRRHHWAPRTARVGRPHFDSGYQRHVLQLDRGLARARHDGCASQRRGRERSALKQSNRHLRSLKKGHRRSRI